MGGKVCITELVDSVSRDGTIGNRGGGGIGNACIKYGDATAHARHGTPPSR